MSRYADSAGVRFDLPEPVRRKAALAGAQSWLDDLPGLVGELERDWGLSLGRTFPDASEALVLEATTSQGTPAVLKLIVPRESGAAHHEITALRLADGRGCARLLRADTDRHAVLVERLGRSLHDLGLPMLRRHDILCDTALQLWRPAADSGLLTGAQKARELVEFIAATWESLGRPCSEHAVAHALDCADRRGRAHDDERARLVHGDVHQWNALQTSDGFALVDPDGLLAEPEYDLGVIMREDPLELMQTDPWVRARRLAARTGLDATAIWEWGVAERVSTGLLLRSIGIQPVADHMLRAAEFVAASSGGAGRG